LFYLFHKIALTIAMQPGFIPVLAKVSSYILLIHFKPGVNKDPREVAADNTNNEQKYYRPVLHRYCGKGNPQFIICKKYLAQKTYQQKTPL